MIENATITAGAHRSLDPLAIQMSLSNTGQALAKRALEVCAFVQDTAVPMGQGVRGRTGQLPRAPQQPLWPIGGGGGTGNRTPHLALFPLISPFTHFSHFWPRILQCTLARTTFFFIRTNPKLNTVPCICSCRVWPHYCRHRSTGVSAGVLALIQPSLGYGRRALFSRASCRPHCRTARPLEPRCPRMALHSDAPELDLCVQEPACARSPGFPLPRVSHAPGFVQVQETASPKRDSQMTQRVWSSYDIINGRCSTCRGTFVCARARRCAYVCAPVYRHERSRERKREPWPVHMCVCVCVCVLAVLPCCCHTLACLCRLLCSSAIHAARRSAHGGSVHAFEVGGILCDHPPPQPYGDWDHVPCVIFGHLQAARHHCSVLESSPWVALWVSRLHPPPQTRSRRSRRRRWWWCTRRRKRRRTTTMMTTKELQNLKKKPTRNDNHGNGH